MLKHMIWFKQNETEERLENKSVATSNLEQGEMLAFDEYVESIQICADWQVVLVFFLLFSILSNAKSVEKEERNYDHFRQQQLFCSLHCDLNISSGINVIYWIHDGDDAGFIHPLCSGFHEEIEISF